MNRNALKICSTVTTHRPTSITTHTTTSKMTDPPIYTPETYPPIPTPPKTKEIPKVPSIHSDAAKSAALVIAIIAGALIAIVLIILLILKFKNRPETSYKVDETKNFCQDPNAALLGAAAGSGQQYNGSTKAGAGSSKNGKKRELKDIKEWYV